MNTTSADSADTETLESLDAELRDNRLAACLKNRHPLHPVVDGR
jgi:hypothetical protein